jgi:hypothetical protein
MMDHTPSAALAELSAQHARLRELIAQCDELADALDAGQIEPAQLLREVARLRVAFDTHNRFEEQLLRRGLLDAEWRPRAIDLARGRGPAPPWPEGTPAGLGAVRVSRMVEDHVEEHRAMRGAMHDASSATTAELRAVLTSLRNHLASEERSFLSRKVLRDDLAR